MRDRHGGEVTADLALEIVSRATAESDAGIRLLERFRFDDAIARFERALQVDPTHLEALFGLGMARQAVGDVFGAADAFESFLQLAPSGDRTIEARHRVAALRAQIDQRPLETAEPPDDGPIAVDPTGPSPAGPIRPTDPPRPPIVPPVDVPSSGSLDPSVPPAPSPGPPAPGVPPVNGPAVEGVAPTQPFQWVLLGIGLLFCLIIVAAAVFIPTPTPYQQSVFRTTLALGASLIAASIPWFAGASDATTPQQAGFVLGGGLGIFVLVFFFDPVGRMMQSGRRAPVPAGLALPHGSVFISYRRGEAPELVGRLHERLEQHFGHGAVFKDVSDILPGSRFRDVLAKALATCRVVIVVIGPRWEQLTSEDGSRRLDDPDDFVVAEVSSVLERGIPLIPALVQRTALPPASQLPAAVAPLREFQFTLLRNDPDFTNDVQRLIEAIAQLIEQRA